MSEQGPGSRPSTGPATVEEAPGEAGRHRPRLTSSSSALVAVAILALAFGLVGLHAAVYGPISPWDEGAHYDYVERTIEGDLLIQPDEYLRQESLRVFACRGADLEGIVLPPCDAPAPYDPNEFPGGGRNYLTHHLPLYHVVTGVLRTPFELLGVGPFTAARLVGGLWLGIGLVLWWMAARRLDIPVAPRIVVLLLLASTGKVLHASATVNNDATAILAGGLVLVALLRWERSGRGLWILALVAALVVGLKVTNIVAVGGGMAYVAARQLSTLAAREGAVRDRRSSVAAIGALAAGSVALIVIWAIVRASFGAAATFPALLGQVADSLDLMDVATQAVALVEPVGDPWLPSFFEGGPVAIAAELFGLVLLAVSLGVLFLLPRLGRSHLFGVSGLFALVVAGPLIAVANFLFLSLAFNLNGRYGLSCVPFLCLALAASLRRTLTLGLVGGLAALSLGAALAGMISGL